MQQYSPDVPANKRQLVIVIWAAVVDVELIDNPIGRNCGFQQFLEICGIVVEK
jgi:hypothetical protein